MAMRQGENDATISWSFRLVNVALHILVVQLIAFTAIYSLDCSYQMNFMFALHFATHPIHTEAVSINESLFSLYWSSSRCIHLDLNFGPLHPNLYNPAKILISPANDSGIK
jgi:hypothetical protein